MSASRSSMPSGMSGQELLAAVSIVAHQFSSLLRSSQPSQEWTRRR
jgi:hypothetical protein